MNPLNYQSRPCLYLGNITVSDSCYKVYVINIDPTWERSAPELHELNDWLSTASQDWHNDFDHGVGFVIVHYAADGDYLLVSRWTDANMLRHRVFSLCDDQELNLLSDPSIIACVWELKLMMAERDFWLKYVLTADESVPETLRLEHYLQHTFEGLL